VTRHTDTARHADVLLPAAAWGEKDGTVTNSERRISRQRAFLSPPGEARPDWWQVSQVAQRLGFGAAFDYASAAQIFREYAELTGFENDGRRDLDISAYDEIDEAAYADLAPFQWPQPKGNGRQETRFFADGGFYTQDHRARFIAVAYEPPAALPVKARPLVLNTGRIRDQWHTMTRTGKAARLMSHIAEPFIEINPEDAIAYGLRAAMIAEVESLAGSILVRVVVTDRQRRGSVFVPMHWSAQMATRARVGSLVAGVTDPISGQPELKHTPVVVRPFKARWHAFVATTCKPSIAGYDYAALAPIGGGYRVEIADKSVREDWQHLARVLLGEGSGSADMVCYQDDASGQHRFAAFRDDVCMGLAFFGRSPVAVSRTFASECIGKSVPPEQRLGLLAGRPGAGVKDRGRIVCSCMGVGLNDIIRAVSEHGCATVGEVGERTTAGTNCGSCRGEIAGLIEACAMQEAV
jgi:assimilatory nitrate reductase catalytic subunit